VPALRALRDAFGAVTVAAPRALAPLAELAGCELVHAEPLQPLDPRLHGADLLVNLHGRGPQSTAVARAARPRTLIAFGAPGPEWRENEHEVARWCRLLTESGIPADSTRLDLPAPPLPDELAHARGATVIHPGAASPARRWPPERFAIVARHQAAVVITGSAGERELALHVAALAGLPETAVLAGRTDLATLAAVVGAAGRVICGDTGLAHLATALGTPSILLFGPTSPDTWGPPRNGRHRVLWAGRTGDPHGTTPDPGLLSITPADVIHNDSKYDWLS
jgi:ADP-heptose:LPS heptosyltransferase